MSSRASARSSARVSAESRMVKQREREHDHQIKWNDQVRYYKSWEKANHKFDEWTSPRYYQTSNKKIDVLKKKEEHKQNLEKRREKLKKLLDEENRTYEIELMVRSRHSYCNKKNEVSAEVLKEVHLGVKLAEEERKRHEAELALYHHWRNNNPVLRDHERARNMKDIKLSWLDQQIEKRVEKQRAEEECRRVLAERDKWLKEEKEKEARVQREIADKNAQLRTDLERQIEALQIKQRESETLQKREEEQAKKLAELAQIERAQADCHKRMVQRELALENIKMHKLKLKQNAIDVRDNLEHEKSLVQSLLESEMAERIENEEKKDEVKKAMREFLKYARDQQDLERKRQQHFDFIFDSEAKVMFDKQREIWLEEEKARAALLRDVFDTIKEQIDENVRRNKDRQRHVLEERQNTLKLLEEYDRKVRENLENEQVRQAQWKKEVELQLKEQKKREAEERARQSNDLDLQMESVRKEEERLRKEIIELQRRQGPVRPSRSRILF